MTATERANDRRTMLATLRPYWHPVAEAEAVANGPIGTTLLGEDLALAPLPSGIVAYRDLCVHRGAKVSLGHVNDRGCLVCPYHGWEYDEAGRCQRIPSRPASRIPSRAAITPYRTEVAYGLVWVALEEPRVPIPAFPESDDPDFCLDFSEPSHWQASAGRVIENNIDISHFPFVHQGLLGELDETEVADFDNLEVRESEIVLRDHRRDAAGGEFGAEREVVVRDSWISVPFTWRIRLSSSKGTSYVFISVQPVTDQESIAYVRVGRQTTMAPISAGFSRMLIEQDIQIVESQRPELLPLDITEELHLRNVDAASLEYRKLLHKATGGTYA